MKPQIFRMFLATILCADMGMGQTPPASQPNFRVRQWTNTEGKTLTAEYLGVQAADVVLKLPAGKITTLPLARFCREDNTFVKQNPQEYHAPRRAWPAWQTWSGWPAKVQFPISFVDVRESAGDAGRFVYTTGHFRFSTNVNLGGTLMKDLAKVFELTYCLQAKSPFGILAKPANGLFEAHLFGTVQQYRAAGGPAQSAGVYKPKDKIKQGVVDRIVSDYESSQRRKVKLKSTERREFLKSDKAPFVANIADVTQMTDTEWATGRATAEPTPDRGMLPPTGSAMGMPNNRLPELYRTAHLILYDFIQIEGDTGVAKLRRFLDENRQLLARYHQHLADFTTYEDRMKEFMRQPGVESLGDRFEYPPNLLPPKAPEAPLTDPNKLELGGDSSQGVGKRIEAALRQDLETNLRFVSP